MIPEETIERVREAADILQIIGEHVNLKRTGSDYRGPCPFHQGTHRNFSVKPQKGIYYCFVCHEGGDVFTFVQKRLGMDWPSAVKYVAERAGIVVEEVHRKREGPDPRQPFWEVNATAADYCRDLLWDDEEGRAARDYLALRRVSREVADRFGLGFAPRDPAAMRGYLNSLGITDERLLEAGLLVRKEESGELRPRFRNRLIFPILDAAGNYVGFGGRLLGPGEPKYLNSAESPVFSKSKLLYGLHIAKNTIRRVDRVMVVEGYFDVVRLVSAGFDWVVAPLGTALTDAQAALLRRYTKNAFLLYDSDKAGLRATFRSGDELLRHGISVQVVTLPEGEDPDSFVDKYGGERLTAQLNAAVDVFERKVQLLERAGWFADLQKKRRALDRLLPTIRAAADALTRDIYLARASEAAGVSKELLQRELGQAGAPAGLSRPSSERREAAREQFGQPSRVPYRAAGKLAPILERGEAAERALVHVMLLNPAEVEIIAERLGGDDLRIPAYREIFGALLDSRGELTPDAIAQTLGPAAVKVVQELLAEPDAVVDVQKTRDGALASIFVRGLERRMAEIDRELLIASEAEKDELIREKLQHLKIVRELGGVGFQHYGKRLA